MKGQDSYQIKQQPMPRNIDAEQALIGAILVNNSAYTKVSNIIEAEHFMEEIHQQIWYVISRVIEKGQVASPITLKTYLGDEDIGEGVTPQAYLARLAADATTVSNAPDYARTVRDLALRRRIIRIAEKHAATAYDAPVEMTAEGLYASLESELEKARPLLSAESSEFEEFGAIPVDDIYEAYKEPDRITGLEVGLGRVDHILAGMQKGDLIILAGRPAMGKTCLATNATIHIAKALAKQMAAGERPGVAGVFSLEMSKAQLKTRIIADVANVPLWKLKKGASTEEEMARVYEAERALARLPLLIDHTGGLSIGQIKMRARTLKKRKGLAFLMVDYLQLLTGDGRAESRQTEVTQITTGLKALAKELQVPILALSQVSRDVEKRDDKRPQLSDLRESGSIEQDADVVMFVYREEHYLSKRKPKENTEGWDRWLKDMRAVEGVAEVIISKNRQGSDGTAYVGFDGDYQRFIQQPHERAVEPEVAREKVAKDNGMSPHGKTLYNVLMDLSISFGEKPTKAQKEHDPSLHLHCRLVRRDMVRAEFSKLFPDDEENTVKKWLNSGANNLFNQRITKNFRDADETDYVYLLNAATN